MHMFNNSGQSCNAPSRMFVPRKLNEVAAIARARREDQGGRSRAPKAPRSALSSTDAVGQDPGADQEGHRRGRHAGRRRPGPARGRQQGLLRPPDDLRRRHQRHDDCARGDFRAGAHHPRRQGRGGRDPDRQRHTLRSRGLRLGGTVEHARKSPGRSAPATSTCTACRTDSRRRSAATSSRATAANGAATASRNTSRRRRSRATTPLKPALRLQYLRRRGGNPLRHCVFQSRRVGRATASAVAQRAKAEACPLFRLTLSKNGGHGASAPLLTRQFPTLGGCDPGIIRKSV